MGYPDDDDFQQSIADDSRKQLAAYMRGMKSLVKGDYDGALSAFEEATHHLFLGAGREQYQKLIDEAKARGMPVTAQPPKPSAAPAPVAEEARAEETAEERRRQEEQRAAEEEKPGGLNDIVGTLYGAYWVFRWAGIVIAAIGVIIGIASGEFGAVIVGIVLGAGCYPAKQVLQHVLKDELCRHEEAKSGGCRYAGAVPPKNAVGHVGYDTIQFTNREYGNGEFVYKSIPMPRTIFTGTAGKAAHTTAVAAYEELLKKAARGGWELERIDTVKSYQNRGCFAGLVKSIPILGAVFGKEEEEVNYKLLVFKKEVAAGRAD